MRLIRWVLLVAVLTLALAALAVGPAQAQAQTFQAEGPTSPGETVTVSCPSPEWTFVSGTIDFFRNAKTRKVLASSTLEPVAGDPSSGQAIAPARAGFFRATITCEPPATSG